jgi:hypothetical protein
VLQEAMLLSQLVQVVEALMVIVVLLKKVVMGQVEFLEFVIQEVR